MNENLAVLILVLVSIGVMVTPLLWASKAAAAPSPTDKPVRIAQFVVRHNDKDYLVTAIPSIDKACAVELAETAVILEYFKS